LSLTVTRQHAFPRIILQGRVPSHQLVSRPTKLLAPPRTAPAFLDLNARRGQLFFAPLLFSFVRHLSPNGQTITRQYPPPRQFFFLSFFDSKIWVPLKLQNLSSPYPFSEGFRSKSARFSWGDRRRISTTRVKFDQWPSFFLEFLDSTNLGSRRRTITSCRPLSRNFRERETPFEFPPSHDCAQGT